MAGQINLDSKFGKTIQEIASNPSYSTFCEVGTWNGLGSTVCLYSGLQHRENVQLYSIEGNRDMYNQAVAHWKNFPKITLLFGSLHRNVLSRSEVEQHPLFYKIKDHYDLHYNSEYQSTIQTPLVSVPYCDVILIDGGEFCGKGDWEILYHSSLKVVMLDDTQVMKTNEIHNTLLQHPEWKCLHNYPEDRNGWSVFERI